MAKAIYSNCAYFQDSINIFIPAKFHIFPCLSFLPSFLSEEKGRKRNVARERAQLQLQQPISPAHLQQPPHLGHLHRATPNGRPFCPGSFRLGRDLGSCPGVSWDAVAVRPARGRIHLPHSVRVYLNAKP